MQFEKIRRINKSKAIIGGVITLGVIGAITILPSFAKYRLTDSINIANGVVNYKVPDFNVVAMYKSDDGTNYTEINGRMPESGYTINEEKSYCNLITGGEDEEAILKTVNGNHVIANLIKGDKCYLYFDKKTPGNVEELIASLNPKTIQPNFRQIAITNEGVYAVEDGMYGGNSYYWRGAVNNNYVKFANFCWRIIRINGDGSIRLIYDGDTCHANGTITSDSVAIPNEVYNSSYYYSEFVGYTYTQGNQRGDSSSSNLKTKTEDWYRINITDKGYDEKIASGKYCNDREVASGYNWSSFVKTSFYYAAYERLNTNRTPTLSCANSGDVYNIKVGAITADEVSFAGGVYGTANSSYYLYNGQDYWTMTPNMWFYGTAAATSIFNVKNDGSLISPLMVNAYAIRPVINLPSNTEFKSGTDGALNNPYEIL